MPRARRDGVSEAQEREVARGNYYSVQELARELGYSVQWVRLKVQNGQIKAVKPMGNGSWRIPVSEVRRLQGQGDPETPAAAPASAVEVIDVPPGMMARVEPTKPRPYQPGAAAVATTPPQPETPPTPSPEPPQAPPPPQPQPAPAPSPAQSVPPKQGGIIRFGFLGQS